MNRQATQQNNKAVHAPRSTPSNTLLCFVASPYPYASEGRNSSRKRNSRKEDVQRKPNHAARKQNCCFYGAGGAVGGAVAKAFAREGARVFLTGRNLSNVDTVAKEIVAARGKVEGAKVDALEEREVEDHLSSVVRNAGRIDISFNAITPVPQPEIQGVPIEKLSVDSFTTPIAAYMRSHFLSPLSEYMIPRDAEISLAKSAAPASISDRATLKSFTARGYEVVHQGDNGWVCFVMRGFTGAPTFTPVELRTIAAYDPKFLARSASTQTL